jgi:hypothetical protein
MLWLLRLAGIGQIGLFCASFMIPKILHWKEELAKLMPLTRQVYWTYAAYILTINLCFGVLSLFAPQWLLDKTPLAGAVCAFIATYWGARVIIQFTYYDRSAAPSGAIYKVAEFALVGLFAFCTLVYGYGAYLNFA